MFRTYENPVKLQDMLNDLIEQRGCDMDEDSWISLEQEIAELEERINFAWQDDEYDGYDDGYGIE